MKQTTCPKCKQPVYEALVEGGGTLLLNPKPGAHGTIYVNDKGQALGLGRRDPSEALGTARPLYTPHQCPQGGPHEDESDA